MSCWVLCPAYLFRAKGLSFHLVEFDGRSDYGPFITQEVFIPGVWVDAPLSFPLSSLPFPSLPCLWVCVLCDGCAEISSCLTSSVHSQDDLTMDRSLRLRLTYQVEELEPAARTLHSFIVTFFYILLLLLFVFT